MESKSHALAAGAFVLLLSALLLAMVLWLMRDTTDWRELELVTNQTVSGLQPQAAVRYKGVLVGRVQSITLDKEVPGQIRIRIAVEPHTPLTTATFATLGYQGVTGLAFVQLEENTVAGQALPPVAEGALARIPLQSGFVSRLTEQGGNLLEKLDTASQQFNALLQPQNQTILVNSIAEMGQAARQMAELARQTQGLLAQSEATLQSVQAVPERMNNSFDAMRVSAEEFRRVNARMNGPGGTLEKMERSAEAIQSTLLATQIYLIPQINRTADQGELAMQQWRQVADEVATNPDVLLWGKSTVAPGPGEKGFVAP
jgi:phospholipid/cholesterol/gamma-HCH transport system substrate-binding protein